MLRNYLAITIRTLLRAKGYAFLNMAGLAVGMAASALIVLWIQSELTYDRFYQKTERLYQVYNRDVINGEAQAWETTPRPLAPTLKQNYPDIEEAARYRPITLLLAAGDKSLNVDGAFVDPSFLNLFDVSFRAGNPAKALAGRSGIVLTQALAQKLFGTADAVGKLVQIDHKDSFSVTGVLDGLPDNSRFSGLAYLLPYDYFVSLGWGSDEWVSNNDYTFVTLKSKADPAAVGAKIRDVTAAQLKSVLDDASHRQLFLHPADKWHLYARQEKGQLIAGKLVAVRLFGLVALFILLIAAVNFINLSTARSEKRAKEVGIRKVAGAKKTSLVIQFIGESVVLAFLAGLLALLLLGICLPAFNTLTGKSLSLHIDSAGFWLVAIGFMLFTGLLAGSYPAFFLAGFQPIQVMKGTYRPAKGVFSPRKGLVVTQFTFAIVLIMATLVIQQQIRHAQRRDSGYNPSNLLFTYLSGDLQRHYGTFQQDLIRSGAAVSVTKSMGPMTEINTRQWGLAWPGSTKADKDIEFDRFGADADFLKTTGATLHSGREIDIRTYPTDSTAVLLNETAVKTMRLGNPIGASIRFMSRDWHVVGVVKDFIFASPYEPVKPVIVAGPGGPLSLDWSSIRLNPANPTATNLALVDAIVKKHNPGYPFEYAFADEAYKAKFADEQRVGSLTGLFSGLTVFIACLGLFGLAAFTAQQRTKEIGVRKVLGATVGSVIQLLTKEFVQLMGLAFLIGAPIGWYAMERWLQDYQYRITIGVGVFALTLLIALVIVLLTVSFQSIRAALMNPVKSLRSE
ncbi:Macrolide export ATP-binding/permease protein macB [Fibrella aestuarina BUZ 2]|uniref:Macrolide export ATP-binding/permease protein macB n=1 Tax=Fibrella aestuarina BUZ 2 TaxID=1166018 RepID=I0K267_9BACT|nr:ABC transporter permease [Fibrella aestuarina]CCG98220.1 Macrolide export ATP-binding/permease protein macB [Fibrella aestuarina BUZ 2]